MKNVRGPCVFSTSFHEMHRLFITEECVTCWCSCARPRTTWHLSSCSGASVTWDGPRREGLQWLALKAIVGSSSMLPPFCTPALLVQPRTYTHLQCLSSPRVTEGYWHCSCCRGPDAVLSSPCSRLECCRRAVEIRCTGSQVGSKACGSGGGKGRGCGGHAGAWGA